MKGEAMINEREIKPLVNRAEVEEQRRLLLSIKPRNKIVERMIKRSLKALEDGVVPMTPEEIKEYLGRES